MDYVDFMIWKAIVLVIAAFIWGVYRGATGQPLSLERKEDRSASDRQGAAD